MIAGDQMNPAPVEGLTKKLDDKIDGPLAVVVGGGAAARRYIDAARQLGLDESGLDELGIQLTRANAWLLIAGFGGDVYPTPAQDLKEAATALRSFDRVCMGGTHPGHTTDAVAAMLAERAGADRVVVVTNVDGVYTSDPKQDPDAELLEQITPDELVELAGRSRQAGSSTVIDPLAAQVVDRSGIPARVVSGGDNDNVASAVAGEAFHGTRIEP